MITIKLANGKEVSSESGEEIFWFNQTEGKSIVKPILTRQGEIKNTIEKEQVAKA